MQSRRTLSARISKANGRDGTLRRQPQGIWMRRNVERGVRARNAGAGVWRQRSAVFCERAVCAGDVSHLCVRQRGAEAAMAAEARDWRKAWLLRAYRTRDGTLRRQPQGIWMRRNVERGVRARNAGAGVWRQRSAVFCERAVCAGDVSHLCVRQRGAEAAMAAEARDWRKAWLLRAYRT